MDSYTASAYAASKAMTNQYSSSFGLAIKLFPSQIRQHIYNIYGLVRLADEIVDTYNGKNAGKQLDDLESETYNALKTAYSTNLIVHAFVQTANSVGISKALISPFFASMRADLKPKARFTSRHYQDYIYGSAEVVGLMCLKVFCEGNDAQYTNLIPGARALGSAFQKVNFLRDIAADYSVLGRYYFPTSDFDHFDDDLKEAIVSEIGQEFTIARLSLLQMPPAIRHPIGAAYNCYVVLLKRLAKTPANELKQRRVRINNARKLEEIKLARIGIYRRAA